MMGNKPHLFIAIPAIDELDFLPATFAAIEKQKTDFNFSVYVCVNQPDEWWNLPAKIIICKNNHKLIKWLQSITQFDVKIIDRSTKGNGWRKSGYGVGWARKTLFDEILKTADKQDIIISLDADTLFNENYFQSIAINMQTNKVDVISVPYFHKLTNNNAANRAILRYELYMRSYFLEMNRIDSPYNFTAVGSAIAMRVSALQKIGGITPMKSGEDFYLLQKLRKMTTVSNFNDETVFPAARFSARVFFGTGPAMIKGADGNWESYPIYHFSLFDKVKETYEIIPQLFEKDIDTEFICFLKEQYKTENLWQPLRNNFKTLQQFSRAFHEKADGLRILQFLKKTYLENPISDERALFENLNHIQNSISYDSPTPFSEISTENLNEIRDEIYEREIRVRNN